VRIRMPVPAVYGTAATGGTALRSLPTQRCHAVLTPVCGVGAIRWMRFRLLSTDLTAPQVRVCDRTGRARIDPPEHAAWRKTNSGVAATERCSCCAAGGAVGIPATTAQRSARVGREDHVAGDASVGWEW
jgi:hypothetical protein